MAQLKTSAAETQRRLRTRIAELEALVEARTHTIVGLSAQLAEHQGTAPAVGAARLAEAERALAELRATKVIRYTALLRRVYAGLRRGGAGG